jgi:hypothetical protein
LFAQTTGATSVTRWWPEAIGLPSAIVFDEILAALPEDKKFLLDARYSIITTEPRATDSRQAFVCGSNTHDLMHRVTVRVWTLPTMNRVRLS